MRRWVWAAVLAAAVALALALGWAPLWAAAGAVAGALATLLAADRARPRPEAAAPAAAAPQGMGGRQEAPRLRRMLDSLDTAVIALDAEHRLLYLNLAGQRLLHLAAAPALGDRLPAVARVPEVIRLLERLRPGETSRLDRLELADGRVWQMEIVALDDPPGGAAILVRDASELARLEAVRRDFIAAVSHELRTPLTSIRGYAEILRDDPGLAAKQGGEYLDVIAANARRLERLAQDLVTLSSLESGQYPFHYRELDPAELLAPAAAVLAPLAAEQGCRVRVEAAAPGRVRADPEALHRVLLNLIENAILHGGAGTDIFVAGRAVALESGKQAYRLEVRDTGAGIGSADQPHVFERFYRVDRSRTRSNGGSGLGLALVKHIVREHGGEVAVSSQLGQGSTFVCTLPGAPGHGSDPRP